MVRVAALREEAGEAGVLRHEVLEKLQPVFVVALAYAGADGR